MGVVALGNKERTYALLITDDDEDFRDSLRSSLEPDGYETYIAGSGTEAIEVVRTRIIHVALVDVFMPGLDGIETLKLIRQEIRRYLPCILMSGDTAKGLQAKALAADAYSLIRKPVNTGIVRHVVREALLKYYYR